MVFISWIVCCINSMAFGVDARYPSNQRWISTFLSGIHAFSNIYDKFLQGFCLVIEVI
jgi:hypothetical protein